MTAFQLKRINNNSVEIRIHRNPLLYSIRLLAGFAETRPCGKRRVGDLLLEIMRSKRFACVKEYQCGV